MFKILLLIFRTVGAKVIAGVQGPIDFNPGEPATLPLNIWRVLGTGTYGSVVGFCYRSGFQASSSRATPSRPAPLTAMIVVCCTIAFSQFPADRTVVNRFAFDDSFDASGVPRFQQSFLTLC